MPHVLRPVPPDFSLANDEIVVFLPRLATGEIVKLRIRNAKKSGPAKTAHVPEKLLDNQ